MIKHKDHFHGSDLEKIEQIYGIKKEEIVSFSANVNPLGVSPLLRTALSEQIDVITTYPDREYTSLRKCIAEYCGTEYENVIVGNGSTELISLFIQIEHPKKAMVIGPTYSEYEREISLGGGTTLYYPLREKDNFRLDVDDFISHLNESIDLIVICNPNNPTSSCITRTEMRHILDACKEHDIYVMVDETYVEYYIVAEKMHAGRNFGKIRLEIPGQEPLIYTVCATTKQENKTKDEPVFFDIQKSRIKLMQLYLEYRLKRIVTGVWANQSGVILDHLSVLCENEKIYGLMKAQTLIINRQRQEASWILDDFKRTCEDHESPEWGYYLYLCTLMEREPSYVDRLTAEVEQIFKLHPDNSMLFWVLLFLKEEYYQKPAERLEAIRDWMRYDNSPYFFCHNIIFHITDTSHKHLIGDPWFL